MNPSLVKTDFAPAERIEKELIYQQAVKFNQDPLLTQMINSISSAVLILNQYRQVVYANDTFLNMLGIKEMRDVQGSRPGELMGCIYADTMEAGCGTDEHCGQCGAIRAVLNSMRDGIQDTQECRIAVKHSTGALDLQVMATPIIVNGDRFTVACVTDIADNKRKEVLERMFLHDVKNTAGGLNGFSKLLKQASTEKFKTYGEIIEDLSAKLLDEIDSFSQLMKAERNELELSPVNFTSIDFLRSIQNLYSNHSVSEGKSVKLDEGIRDLNLFTDITVLGRVVGNITKNALEAIKPGETVTLGCKMVADDKVQFYVSNPGEIPRKIQMQIFQRSFSTKGGGRGLGTYSIKLLSEQYLQGEVGFESSQDRGTTFSGIYPINLNT